MHATVALWVGKDVLFREVSSFLRHAHRGIPLYTWFEAGKVCCACLSCRSAQYLKAAAKAYQETLHCSTHRMWLHLTQHCMVTYTPIQCMLHCLLHVRH